MKGKNILKLVSALVLTILGLFLYNSFFGNPISYIKAKSEVQSYIDKNYKNILEIESMSYNWKFGGYSAKVVDEKYTIQPSYIDYTRFGNIIDGYHEGTMFNMMNEVETSINALINQGTDIDRNCITLSTNIDIPEFRYKIYDKYSGKEPICVDINLHPYANYTEEKYSDDAALYKSEEEFLEDSYKILKVLKDINYDYEAIEIYSYREDGNSNYRIKIDNINQINSIKDVKDKMFIQGNIKEQEIKNLNNNNK